MQRCARTPLTPSVISQCLRMQQQQQQEQQQQPLARQRRLLHHDPEPARKKYLEQIHRGLGDDGHGNPLSVDPEAKTITTAAGALPISPLMDPHWLEATKRWRHEKKKPEGSTQMTRFRKKLYKNPYALALSTPIRRCVKTFLPMPRFFLQPFGIVFNPETRSNWWAPKDIAFEANGTTDDGDDAPMTSTAENIVTGQDGDVDIYADDETESSNFLASLPGHHTSPEDDQDLPEEGQLGGQDLPEEGQLGGQDLPAEGQLSDQTHAEVASSSQRALVKPKTRRYDPSAHTLLRQHVMVTTKRPLRIMVPNWEGPSARAVMREDMREFILNMLRRQIVAGLLYLARLHVDENREYILPCPGWDAAAERIQRGCVLWTRPPSWPAQETEDNPVVGDGQEPGNFATFDMPGDQAFLSRIPVHNLHLLLGKRHLAQLREESPLFRDNWLFMLSRKRSLELQIQFWQLQGYLLPPWSILTTRKGIIHIR